jgi:predicted DNA-binding transcriptional regulator AlpA
MKIESSEFPEPTLRAEEFMGMLQISPNTFKKLLAEGKVPAPLPLGDRNRRWSRVVVMSFLNKQDKNNPENNQKAKGDQ